jgi:hypothetical protein
MHNRTTRFAMLLGLVLMAPLTAAPAAAQGTPEQRAACEGDAMRLCGQFVPDVSRITACMHSNRRHLSPRCRAMFKGSPKRLKKAASAPEPVSAPAPVAAPAPK